MTASAAAAMIVEAEPPPSLDRRNRVSWLVAKASGRNPGSCSVGETQAAMAGSRRRAACWRAVSKMPSPVL
jgi:hypothetical protein